MKFYRSVFKSEFSGKGIQRFGDIPQEANHHPVSDSIKKMVLHVELPILGGHVLMATDAPKEMGFTLTQGNNMHICLEPDHEKKQTGYSMNFLQVEMSPCQWPICSSAHTLESFLINTELTG
jgi:PhnB protein